MNETAVIQTGSWTTQKILVVVGGGLMAAFVIGYLYGPIMFGKR